MSTDSDTRLAAVNDLHGNLFVEAGAGTGKTTLLVSRLCALVIDEQRPLANIAAITFTEKAAAELRDRFRSELTARGRPDLVAQLDEATITTIHGFARAVLATHPLAARLPPEFTVVSELESAIDFDRRFQRFGDELLVPGGPYEQAVLTVLVLGAGRRELAGLARRLDDQRDRLVGLEHPIPPPFPDADTVVATLQVAVAMRHSCLDRDDRLAVHLSGLADVIESLLDADGDAIEQLRVLTGLKVQCGYGQKKSWIGAHSKDDVVDALVVAEAARVQFCEQAGHYVVATLLPPLSQFIADGTDTRRRAGTLDFQDLLIEARELLATDARVRADVSERWPHILVDEFQDTDPVQLDLITLIASVDDDPGAIAWQQRHLGAGTLFAVGDPKQSIYRFRGADMQLFRQAAAIFSAGSLLLDQNFRTVPGVLEWVNSVMQELFGASRPEQATFRPLRPARAGNAGPAVEILGLEPIDGNAAEVRAQEADELVATLVRFHQQRLLIEPKVGPRRPVNFRDMAILLPARTALPTIEAALEAQGVPYRIESRSLVYATAEVRTLAVVLRAVDDPADEIAVVGALRSTAFACSDADLVSWRGSGGSWSPFAPRPDDVEADHPVATALSHVAALHSRRWFTSIDALVHAVIDECQLREAALAHGRPRDRWRRQQLVIDQAMAFEAVGGRTLRAFVDWLDSQRELAIADTETAVPDLDDDAVRILTVHAAKGLEFPVVALAGLGSPDLARLPPVLWDDDGHPVVRLGRQEFGFQHPGYGEAWGKHRTMEEAEDQRLLYVAATRARDRLLVCLHRNGKRRSPAERVHALLSDVSALWQVHQSELPFDEFLGRPASERVEGSGHGGPAGRTGLTVESPLPFDSQAWEQRHQIALSSARAPVISATALIGSGSDSAASEAAHLDRSGPADPDPRLDDCDDAVGTPRRRGRAGTSIGRAVHAVLQSIDLTSPDGVEDVASLQAAAEGIASLAGEVARLVRNVLAAPIVVEASESRHWREVFVAAPINGTCLEGFIDLLIERSDGSLVVVDYKTDSARNDPEVDLALGHYRRQGAAYAVAVEASLGRPVSEVVFVFARTGAPALQRSLNDLASARIEVLDLLGAAGGGV